MSAEREAAAADPFWEGQRRWGGALATVCILAMAFLMAREARTVWGVGLGLLLDLAATVGLMAVFKMFRAAPPLVTHSMGPAGAPYRDGPVASSVGSAPWFRPEGVVLVASALLLLPQLSFGLWDPWETHYGEVAREILSRDDWLSLWWQDEWFWSKPIGLFWMSATSMALLGVEFHPDGAASGYHSHAILPVSITFVVLAGAALWRARRVGRQHGARAAVWTALVVLVPLGLVAFEVGSAHVKGTLLELALRLPVVLSAMAALWVVAWSVRRIFSDRAALLAGLALLTMPHYFLLAHQAMVDMPFVACLVIAMCVLMVAWAVDPEERAPGVAVPWRGRRLELSVAHGIVGVVLATALPQILYLATRHLTIGHGLSIHADRFESGSADNGPMSAASPHLRAFPPILQAIFFGAPLAMFLLRRASEDRLRPLMMFAFYYFGALSLMSKGLPGVLVPGLVALGYLGVSRRWSLLGQIELWPGAAIICSVGLPWYVGMFVRHGPRFTDRLLIHDHINRLAVGVHGDTGSVQYFIGQLGYGTFPWCALALVGTAAILLGSRTTGQTNPAQDEAHRLTFLWFVLSFLLFSVMVTKFHHYIFPAVPPLAMLAGIFLDRSLGPSGSEGAGILPPAARILPPASGAQLGFRIAWHVLLPVLILGPVWVFATASSERWELVRTTPLLRVLGPGWLALLLCSAGGYWLALRAGVLQLREPERVVRASVAAALMGGAAVVAMVGRDLADTASTARPKGYERLIDLFVYNYSRAWPATLDFSPTLAGFAILATLISLMLVSSRLRRAGVHAVLVLAFGFALWAQHVYIRELTPHWSQRHLIDTYYDERRSAEERLVAWQMNWHGENLYSGGRAVIYASVDNTEFERWVDRHAGETHFFILERGRLGNLRRILSKDEDSCPILDDSSNKFVLVRARL